MERRTFLAMVPGSLLAAPLAAEAQPAGKVPVGYYALSGLAPLQRPLEASGKGCASSATSRVRNLHRVSMGGG